MLHFTLVRTLEPTLLFFQIDHDSRAKDWCEALEEVIRFYYEDKHEVWNSRFRNNNMNSAKDRRHQTVSWTLHNSVILVTFAAGQLILDNKSAVKLSQEMMRPPSPDTI